MSFFRLATRSLPRATFTPARFPSLYAPRARYSAAAGLSRDSIQSRVLDVLKGFEKVDQAKVPWLNSLVFFGTHRHVV